MAFFPIVVKEIVNYLFFSLQDTADLSKVLPFFFLSEVSHSVQLC